MRPAPPARIRPTALLLVLLAHVPLVLLFLWGWRVPDYTPEPQLVFLSLWPQMPREKTLAPQPPPQQLPQRPAQPGTAPPARTARLVAPSAGSPSTAIAAPTASAAPTESTRSSIDWRAEAAAAAGRAAAPAPPAEFAPPPKAIRKPCEKPKSSWEWNEQPKKAGLAPLPYVVLGRCVVGLGFFACSPQKPPEANSHLLDDMRDGKTSPSSVPDPVSCD